MNQSRDTNFLGENLRDHTVLPSDLSVAEMIFEVLSRQGTKYMVLSGGIGREEIFRAVSEVIK
jgi:hypothetical protein